MAMSMVRAFNSKMESPCVSYVISAGRYDSTNTWIPGKYQKRTFHAVIQAGNQYSQFDEGIARHDMEGGNRFSNYRNMYVKDQWPELKMDDRVEFRNTFYNILQKSDEAVFGFHSYIIEKDKHFKG